MTQFRGSNLLFDPTGPHIPGFIGLKELNLEILIICIQYIIMNESKDKRIIKVSLLVFFFFNDNSLP